MSLNNTTFIVGRRIDTVHVEGDSFVDIVLIGGEVYRLQGMRLVSYDGNLEYLLDGYVDTIREHDFSGWFRKEVKVEFVNSYGDTVTFNFKDSQGTALSLIRVE